jgi:Spy/CpxP family protein refolding chaperone
MHRFKRAGFIGVLLAALSLSSVGFACPPFESQGSHRDPGAFIEKNAEALGVDAETLTAIRNIVEKSRGSVDSLQSGLRESHEGMKALLDQGTPDEAAVMKQAEAIGAAETAMQKHRLGTMLEIRALLTSEQREEMARLRGAGCPMHQGGGCAMHKGGDCPMHKGGDCPMHKGGDCPMHKGGDCPMHKGGDCPMHKGADGPMKQGEGCPMHRGMGSSEKPQVSETY